VGENTPSLIGNGVPSRPFDCVIRCRSSGATTRLEVPRFGLLFPCSDSYRGHIGAPSIGKVETGRAHASSARRESKSGCLSVSSFAASGVTACKSGGSENKRDQRRREQGPKDRGCRGRRKEQGNRADSERKCRGGTDRPPRGRAVDSEATSGMDDRILKPVARPPARARLGDCLVPTSRLVNFLQI
jgi:hypothetical protein